MAGLKKIERFRITAHVNRSGTQSWRVTGTNPDGSRVRQNFKDEIDAIRVRNDLEMDAAGEPETSRAMRTILDGRQLADAEAATRQAGGLSLTDIVSHYIGLRNRAIAKGTNLDGAIAFAESRFRPETMEISILNGRAEFLKAKADLAPKTLTYYETNLNFLLKPDPNKPVHAFTVTDIEKVIGNYTNANSRRTLRQAVSVFFNWAVRHHYCLENPCKRLDRLQKNTTRISILTLDEIKRLLTAAIQYQEGVAAASVVIALFAGLRPSELADLKPADIRKESILIRGGKMRRSGNRVVPLPENLKAWLVAFPFTGLPGGWDYKMKQLKAATKAKHWVQDILRHTSISHQAERDNNEGLTAFNNGTSKGMMDRHYRDLIGDAVIISAYWSLTPAAIRRAGVKVTLPSGVKLKWPSKAALKKLVWQKPLIHAATDIGVSDVALRKHCVKLGIELPPRGHWIKG